MERKLRLVKEQASIVLAPKMREMHLLTQMLFAADKAINRMRMEAGTAQMPLRELEAASGRIVKFTQRVKGFTGALGGQSFYFGLGFDPREGPPIDDDRSRPKRGQGSGHQIEQIVAADQGPEESQGVGGEDRGTQTGHAHGRERQRGTATRCRISSMRASDSWMRTRP